MDAQVGGVSELGHQLGDREQAIAPFDGGPGEDETVLDVSLGGDRQGLEQAVGLAVVAAQTRF